MAARTACRSSASVVTVKEPGGFDVTGVSTLEEDDFSFPHLDLTSGVLLLEVAAR